MPYIDHDDEASFDLLCDFFVALLGISELQARANALALVEHLDASELIIAARPEQEPDHEQVEVQVGAWRAKIDRGMVEIVRRLWEAGVPTAASCENGLRSAYVSFPDPDFVIAPWFASVVVSASDYIDVDEPVEGRDYSVVRWHVRDHEQIVRAVLEADLDPPVKRSTQDASAVRDFYDQ